MLPIALQKLAKKASILNGADARPASASRQMKLTDFKSLNYVPNLQKLASASLADSPSGLAPLDNDAPKLGARNSATKKRRQSLVKDGGGKRLQQQVIDANQKEIGARLCKKCGFIGDFDDENDRKLHGKIHSLHEKGRVDGDGVLRYKSYTEEHILESDASYKITAIQGMSGRHLLKKAQSVIRFAENDIGGLHLDYLHAVGDLVLLLVDIQLEMIVGCLCAQNVAGKVLVTPNDAMSVTEAVKPSSTPRCGISLIWVTRRHRRKGLGTRMLDCIRNHFCLLNYKYGNVMEKSSVAFTEPSDEGLKFIAAYMEGNAANIYLWDNLKIHE